MGTGCDTTEELVQRFEAGERTPLLLWKLNLLAWECFHAPWERRPFPTIHILALLTAEARSEEEWKALRDSADTQEDRREGDPESE